MSEIELFANFGTVTDEDGVRVIAFAASDDPEDGYVFVQQSLSSPDAPIYLEISDEIFGADDAVEGATFAAGRITLTIRPEMVMRFGSVARLQIHWTDRTEGGLEAAAALQAMLTP